MIARSTAARQRVLTLATAFAIALTVAIAGTISIASSAEAAAPPRFANCAAMHKQRAYLGGISRPGAKDKRAHGGHARYRPYVNASYYQANTRLDADHDGIACEQ